MAIGGKMENRNFCVKNEYRTPILASVECKENPDLTFDQLLKLANASKPEERKGLKIYKGFTFKYAEEILDLVPAHFWMVEEWCYDTFRVVWISKKYRSIFTYCEGDLILEVCESMGVFEEQLKRLSEFYKDH